MIGKATLRDLMRSRRSAETDREVKSRHIVERVTSLDSFMVAEVVSSYVGIEAEVATIPLLEAMLDDRRIVAVPWVEASEIWLTRLETLDELVTTRFGLLEPSPEFRDAPTRRVAAETCGVFLVPGVAFDREGYRLGHGRGYYDRLLSRASPSAVRIGLAFECQIVERIPREEHDQRMDVIVTEVGTYQI